MGGKGNEGVSAFVQRLHGSIGYVEVAYAKSNHMAMVELQNSEGNFVPAEDKNIQAAAAGAEWSKSFYQILTNQPGKESWPITSGTFVIVHKTADDAAKAEEVLKFFDYGYQKGDTSASALQYVTIRITSYNVCYTKLLRAAFKRASAPRGAQRPTKERRAADGRYCFPLQRSRRTRSTRRMM